MKLAQLTTEALATRHVSVRIIILLQYSISKHINTTCIVKLIVCVLRPYSYGVDNEIVSKPSFPRGSLLISYAAHAC